MSVLQELVAELEAARGSALTHTKAVSSTPMTIYGHGNGGLFSYPGLERDILNAMVMPSLGLLDLLPSRTSMWDNPLYGIITGVTAGSGSNPTGVCDDPPTAGLMKLCTHTFVWGRQSLQTPVIDIDRVGRMSNRSEFNDFQIIGGPRSDNPLLPTIPGSANLQAALRGEVAKVLFEFAVEWSRRWARLVYEGNPTNNTSGGGYKEPYGLNILINDGYRDAETGVACPAADSLLMDFGGQRVDSAGSSFVDIVTSMWRYLKDLADQTGLAPATWGISLPRAMFWEITEVWPCAYMTYQCHTGVFTTSDVRVTDAGELVRMRDSMRQGQYLLIDGAQVPVVFDDGIRKTSIGAGVFEADIYFVPLRVLGNRPVTFLEYVDYDAPNGAMDAARILAPSGSFRTSNGGRYLWHTKPSTNFCVQMLAKSEWRIVMETPYLAARLENVRYAPLINSRDALTDETYFVNGGSTNRLGRGPSYYSPTS